MSYLPVLGLICVNLITEHPSSPVREELEDDLLSDWAAIPKGCPGSGEAQ